MITLKLVTIAVVGKCISSGGSSYSKDVVGKSSGSSSGSGSCRCCIRWRYL